jgi:small-conductance mechanosensitive channel
MDQPDPRMHQLISFTKSAVRIISSVVSVVTIFANVGIAVAILAVGYGLAEVIGVYEELV